MFVNTEKLGVLVLGCGGVGYHTATLIAVVGKDKPILIYDDDTVTRENTRRQWIGWEGREKVEAMEELLGRPIDDEDAIDKWYETRDALSVKFSMGGPLETADRFFRHQGVESLLILCMVDTLEARKEHFEAAEFFGAKEDGKLVYKSVVLLTAGCSGKNAQAHAFVMTNGEVVWDARKYGLFENVATEDDEAHCGEQTALANHAAGTMMFNLWEYILHSWEPGNPMIQLCWDVDSRKGPRIYSLVHSEKTEEE